MLFGTVVYFLDKGHFRSFSDILMIISSFDHLNSKFFKFMFLQAVLSLNCLRSGSEKFKKPNNQLDCKFATVNT